jgi:hypothetical protein
MHEDEKHKPRGTDGIIEFSDGAAWAKQIILPETKAGLERYIAEAFVRNAVNYGDRRSVGEYLGVNALRKNDEADLDFTLLRSGVPFIYLELVEYAPLSPSIRYGDAPRWYSTIDRAEELFRLIAKKAAKYVGVDLPIALLVYRTDVQFAIDDDTRNALRHRLYVRPDAQKLALVFTRNANPTFHNDLLYDVHEIDRYKIWARENRITESSFAATSIALAPSGFKRKG